MKVVDKESIMHDKLMVLLVATTAREGCTPTASCSQPQPQKQTFMHLCTDNQ
jgi:hypothetical protein